MTEPAVAVSAVGSSPGPTAGEQGATPVSALAGVAVFLGFLLLTSQVLLYLLTASVVQAAAVDGATAGAADPTVAVRAAEDRAAAVLGGLAAAAHVEGSVVSDVAGATVEVRIGVRLPSVFGGLGLTRIERRARARVQA